MPKSTRKTLIIALITAIVMFGFSFALAPLYSVFCQKTGLRGSTKIEEAASTAVPDTSRKILVQFVATNNKELPWQFYPLTTRVKVYPGQKTKVVFFAKNTTQKTMTVQAIPSYAPPYATQYFHKIECFCFQQQTLRPGESINMPVVFRIDKKLPAEIRTITLAYTLFDVTKPSTRKPS